MFLCIIYDSIICKEINAVWLFSAYEVHGVNRVYTVKKIIRFILKKLLMLCFVYNFACAVFFRVKRVTMAWKEDWWGVFLVYNFWCWCCYLCYCQVYQPGSQGSTNNRSRRVVHTIYFTLLQGCSNKHDGVCTSMKYTNWFIDLTLHARSLATHLNIFLDSRLFFLQEINFLFC